MELVGQLMTGVWLNLVLIQIDPVHPDQLKLLKKNKCYKNLRVKNLRPTYWFEAYENLLILVRQSSYLGRALLDSGPNIYGLVTRYVREI